MAGKYALQNLCHNSRVFVKRNSSTILTCVGAAGVVTTSVLTAKATVKVVDILNAAKEEKGEALTKEEIIKASWKAYIPAAVVGIGTIFCIVGVNSIGKRRYAALASAYSVLDTSYKEYQEKVKEVCGEEVAKEVKQEIAKDKYKDVNIKVNVDEELFYDEYSKRYFVSTKAKVQRAEYELNRDLTMRDFAYLNDWYELLGLEKTDEGGALGWSVGVCMDAYWQPWVDFNHSKIILDDGQECIVVTMFQEPIPDFEDYI